MAFPEITTCPGTLAAGFHSYSRTSLVRVFDGKKVSHVLPYNAPQASEEDAEKFIENRKRISISGVQEKLSLVLDKNKLRLTQPDEQGTYILKPIPRDLRKVQQVPANEHLTMQIARQVYGIQTAENALTFFQNGEPAYITKRFDVKPDGSKYAVEDFASLAGRTSETGGPDFKYDYTYEALAGLVKRYIAASVVELEKLFSLIVFNYLFSNGDAHLKNFSIIETPNGDYVLSPAYDLINTRIHVDDSYLALKGGLFEDDYETESFAANGYYAYDDFYEFGLRIGIRESRVIKLLNLYRAEQKAVNDLVSRSFLDSETKTLYMEQYRTNLKALSYSYRQLM
ncbi:type II toxin-antitoxin system HipA family toxin [Pontibacter sp. SGAir0037]|uniref:type II toxin-antitoxin system HipA family toxin n=1 Tax=Pontibacter sp. SGAir0037 TaxID=2571030 RepID=UPI0010CD53A5|nr:HipA domain-containing protein [Pontibacter sp. SGAir0037]QCR22522.1 phosphatidylinositol kinase [Pontibacter sp. SGAir0037]